MAKPHASYCLEMLRGEGKYAPCLIRTDRQRGRQNVTVRIFSLIAQTICQQLGKGNEDLQSKTKSHQANEGLQSRQIVLQSYLLKVL